jgi:hypothetical protein
MHDFGVKGVIEVCMTVQILSGHTIFLLCDFLQSGFLQERDSRPVAGTALNIPSAQLLNFIIPLKQIGYAIKS